MRKMKKVTKREEEREREIISPSVINCAQAELRKSQFLLIKMKFVTESEKEKKKCWKIS
jgi:hypothetical protein